MAQFDISKIPKETRVRAMEDLLARRGVKLPPAVRARQIAEEAGRRGVLVHRTFSEFVAARRPELLEHEYMRRMIAVAQKVVEGKINRLLVLIPTQYGKSTIWSQLLPAFYLHKHAARVVALASYGADLAWEHSGEARDHFRASGGQFKEGSSKGTSRNWRTARIHGMAGGMWAAGIGGQYLGKGYNLGLVDDPVDPEEAVSDAYKRRFARWWPSSWLRGQRSQKIGGSAIVVVMQRLGIDDPISWLLQREEGDTAENWHICCFDEVKSDEKFGRWDGPLGFPKTCTVEADWRAPGEVLAPIFRKPEEVKRIQAKSGPIITAAQRQMRPMRPTGDFWALKWFEGRTYDELPTNAYNGGWDWDTAYTKEEANSASAGIKSFRGPGGQDDFKVFIEDVFWDWLEFPELTTHLKTVAPPHYVEAKATGKSIVQTLKAYDIVAEEVKVAGDKIARASAAQPAVSAGRVYINKLVYQKLLYGEHQGLLRITAEALIAGGEGLDLNDAFVQSLFRHLGIGAEVKKKAKFG
jgi:hypothetical protein